jgi:hypothetical protein
MKRKKNTQRVGVTRTREQAWSTLIEIISRGKRSREEREIEKHFNLYNKA